MESDKSLLYLNEIKINNDIIVKIPTIGQILENEKIYYDTIHTITASPFSRMVQLDDLGIDFTKVDDFYVFVLFSIFIFSNDLSLIFGNTFSKITSILSDGNISLEEKYKYLFEVQTESGEHGIYDAADDILITKKEYNLFCNALRKINLIEKDNRKAGNEKARKYLLEKERRKLKRRRNKPYEPYLENLVIALVNTREFPYDYDSCMKLSIYQFNQSLKQIQRKIAFDNTMTGVFAGTINTSKMKDKSVLSWI